MSWIARRTRDREVTGSTPGRCQATTLGKLPTPMCLCHQAVQFGTSQRAVMLCGRKVTVGLATHWPCGTDFSGLSTYVLMATEREMSTPTLQPWGMVQLFLHLHSPPFFLFLCPPSSVHFFTVKLFRKSSVRFERKQFDVVQKKISTRYKKIFFSQRIAEHWNKLPHDIVSVATLPGLKTDLTLGWTDVDIKSSQLNESIKLYVVTETVTVTENLRRCDSTCVW